MKDDFELPLAVLIGGAAVGWLLRYLTTVATQTKTAASRYRAIVGRLQRFTDADYGPDLQAELVDIVASIRTSEDVAIRLTAVEAALPNLVHRAQLIAEIRAQIASQDKAASALPGPSSLRAMPGCLRFRGV